MPPKFNGRFADSDIFRSLDFGLRSLIYKYLFDKKSKFETEVQSPIVLRNINSQFFSGERKSRALAPFHIFGGGLRQRRDKHRKRDRRVAGDISGGGVFQ